MQADISRYLRSWEPLRLTCTPSNYKWDQGQVSVRSLWSPEIEVLSLTACLVKHLVQTYTGTLLNALLKRTVYGSTWLPHFPHKTHWICTNPTCSVGRCWVRTTRPCTPPPTTATDVTLIVLPEDKLRTGCRNVFHWLLVCMMSTHPSKRWNWDPGIIFNKKGGYRQRNVRQFLQSA